MADRAEFLAGVVVGALVGIGLGMLLAPQAGHETRERIRRRADEVNDRLRAGTGDLPGRVRATADDIARRGRSAVDESARRIREVFDRDREPARGAESSLEDPEQA